jgi:hypothetical protein
MFADVRRLLTFAAAFGKTFFEATRHRGGREDEHGGLKEIFNRHLQISKDPLLLPSQSTGLAPTKGA